MENLSAGKIIDTPDYKFLNLIQEIEIDKQSKLKISCNDTMILFNISQNIIPKKEYELLLSLEQLCQKSKFFINFESTKDLINWLIKSINQKNSNIIIKEKECVIHILNPISFKFIDLSLIPQKPDLSSRVTKLEEIIIQQNKEISILKEKINKFEPIIEEYNREKGKIKQLEFKVEEYILDYKNHFFCDSNILNENDKNLLLKWIPSNPIKIILLLNSRKDGDSVEVVEKTVSDKKNILVIIQTKDGYKFGGFAAQKWKIKEKIYDKNAFVFSLDKGKKYKIIKPENSYYLTNWWGFGVDENAIIIVQNCSSFNNNFVGNGTYDIKEKYELNGGKQYFTVDRLEIYQIKY